MVTDMKKQQLPKWDMVIRDLRRGPVRVETPEGEYSITLQNHYIPEAHQPESAPNNPLNPDDIQAWAIEQRRWLRFKISELKSYGEQERREDAEDPGRVGNNSPEETPQKT